MERLTFVTAGSSRSQLEKLTQFLVFSFPGSTIYQHTDLLRVPHDVLTYKVNFVLMEAEAGETGSLDLMQKLHRQKPELPVYIISRNNDVCEKAAEAGANGYFVLPGDEQRLLEAMRLAANKTSVS